MSGCRKHVLAVFGAGRMGTLHMRNLTQAGRAQIKYVIEHQSVVDKAKDTLTGLGLADTILLTLQRADTAYNDADVEAVIICSPMATHCALIKAALKAGKSVFCEKPLATSSIEVEECVAEADKAGKHLICGLNRRHDPTHREVWQATRNEDVGKVRVIRSISRDPPAMCTPEYIASSGGIFLDSAIHDLDMILWMAGEAPSSIYATGHGDAPAYVMCGDVDTCNVIVTFPKGTIANVEVSREAPIGHDTRVDVLCERALFKSENRAPSQMERWDVNGSLRSPIYTQGIERYSDSYRKEMDYFINVLEGAPVEMSGQDLITLMKMVEACKKSKETGQVVKL